jgi:hypothetical protein
LKSSPTIGKISKLCHSKKALAIPVSFMLLFVSTLFIVAITYYFAIERINAKSQDLKVSTARGNMMTLDEDVSSVLWQSGSSQTLDFIDSGGQLNIEPAANLLAINITDNNSITSTIFNDSAGWVVYELPYSETADTGLFLKGDNRAILNQTGFSMTQLCIQKGAEHTEIRLRYRPIVSSVTTGTQDNKIVNDVRIYVVDLNSSQLIELMGEVPLKIACLSTESSVTSYNVSYQPGPLFVSASFSDISGQVSVSISSTSYGAIVNVELILCKVQIERWVR